ncbi:MmcQ/YjbR family DNA-binding protein [Thaumasiovibrio sp. DFM-14]|uniref:MmcQ/YjbR family DNA-binding protein n=1 Tax=Thaumasiovibrio sp. DFM-14 TaxID=3384792 RepID=UPI0039A17C51
MNVEALKSYCETLVGIQHDIKWHNVDVFSIQTNKMVCIFYDGDKMACKVDDDLFLSLSQLPHCCAQSHLARAHWVEFGDGCPLPQAELEKIIHRSWTLVVKKLAKKHQQHYFATAQTDKTVAG